MRGRLLPALAFIFALLPATAWAHAALLKSSPKAGATVDSLTRVRLEFSEEVVPSLCHIGLMTSDGMHMDLRVSSDPHNVNAIVAPVAALAPGAYRVMWHVVSADGHPVSGEYSFMVSRAAAPAQQLVPPVPLSADSTALAGGQNPFPFAAALARGIGVTALLSLAGLLVFATGHGGKRVEEYRDLERALAPVAFLGLLVHLVLWNHYIIPGRMFASASWEAMLTSPPGRLEFLRLTFVLVALVLVFARARPRVVALAAGIAAALTAMIGHTASITPALSIPVTVGHLIAVALWSGGILSLIVVRNAEPVAFRAHALLVSRIALVAFVVTALTGAAQSALLLTAAGDLISTSYGRLILAKIAGLLLLGAFGAFHRLRAVPRLPNGGQREMTLSLRYEMTVMALVIIIAAFLSYTPLPR